MTKVTRLQPRPKIIRVSKQEMINFIFSQPDDKKINMREARYDDDCGCIMVHYGKAHLPEFNNCGLSMWLKYQNPISSMKETVAELEFGIIDFVPSFQFQGTYKDIKEYLLARNMKPTFWKCLLDTENYTNA